MNLPALRFTAPDGTPFPKWQTKKLGEVAVFYNEKRVPIKETDRQIRFGSYPYYGASGVIDYIDDYIFDGKYILLAEDGANILQRSSRLCFIVNGKFWLNNHAHIFKSKYSNEYLSEYLESIDFTVYNTGTAQPKLNSQVCKNIPIPLPSLPEQEKIANALTAVDDKITALKDKTAHYEAFKKGLMQQLFPQS